MKIIIIGASGLLGSSIYRFLSQNSELNVFGMVRNSEDKKLFPEKLFNNLISDFYSLSKVDLNKIFFKIKPDVVLNCAGITSHRSSNVDIQDIISINSLFPHHCYNVSREVGARLIHFSTDCVYSGKRGNYKETDISDANDIYGKSKSLGELNVHNALTIRTSFIGHELKNYYSLLNWFLSQDKECIGYSSAIFSGYPAITLARILQDYILTNPSLDGIYNISSNPISKFELLNLIARVYKKDIRIIEDNQHRIDRSLNFDKFIKKTNFKIPEWNELIEEMYKEHYA